jgi:hypothetical protein
MADPLTRLEEGLRLGLSDLRADERTIDVLERHGPEELVAAGRRAVRAAVAHFVWNEAIGPMLDMGEVGDVTGDGRQAVAQAVDAGTLLAIPAGTTRRFPVWQFDTENSRLRPVVSEIIRAFREADKHLEAVVIAAWVTKANQDLGGISPAQWITDGGDDSPVVTAALRAAAPLAW